MIIGQQNGRFAINLGPDYGWSRHSFGSVLVAFKGYLQDGLKTYEGEEAAKRLAAGVSALATDPAMHSCLNQLNGHFSFVLSSSERLVASVDRIRSVPLIFAQQQGTVHIDDRATRLRDTLGLGANDIDPDQALALMMSGCTIGADTLYRGITALRAGEALLVDRSNCRTLRWYVYDAWNTESIASPERRLSELHRHIVERLAASANGRPLCVPLSAGYDSRFIAAGLKAVGAKDVRLFSYGRPGNHEVQTAKAIADRLGYPWTFVPFTTRGQAAMFEDPRHKKALWHDTDVCTAVPFEQDWTAIVTLKASGYIPDDSLIVNGNSGDFISGNHAPIELMEPRSGSSVDLRRKAALDAYLKKHCRLWHSLASDGNDSILRTHLLKSAVDVDASFDDAQTLFGVFEYLEYENRQAKYVVSGQRCYEALGHSWRLPLWDDDLILFWSRMPALHKRRQNLYARVLETDNWADAWTNIPVNRKRITPGWIKPIRLAAKLAHAPLGAGQWHVFERRYFSWWMDSLRTSAIVPWVKAATDRRGARHAVAWIAERYLQNHGVDISEIFKRAKL